MKWRIETFAKRIETLGQEHTWLKFALADTNLEEGTFKGLASVFGSLVQSWMPTVIEPGAFTKTLMENARRIKLLWQHDPSEPIGMPRVLKETDAGLEVEGKISQTARGKDSLLLMRDGVIDELSIGFDPIKWEMEDKGDGQVIRHVKEVRLWEISLVTFAADPMAKVLSIHAVVPFQDLPLADEDRAWDGAAAHKRMVEACGCKGDNPDWNKFKKGHLWFDSDNADKITGYKFLIADIIDGKMMAIPRGIFAAAVVLQGGRGGTNIPEEDQDKMKAHLSRYYKKLDRTAPWDAKEGDALRILLEPLISSKIESFAAWTLQTLVFPKAFWKLADAKKWCKDHDYKTDLDETGDSFRFRQRDPGDFERLRIICFDPSRDTPMDECRIKAIGGPLKQAASVDLTNLELLASVPLEAHEGKVLSAKNKRLLADALAALQNLLAAAEPPEDEPAQGTSKQALTVNAEQLNQLAQLQMWLAQSPN
jgi:HK97 family phage prohead protease